MSLSIEAVRAAPVNIDLVEPLATSRQDYARVGYVAVRVRLSDGTSGFGEGHDAGQITGETQASVVAAINEEFAPALAGVDPFDLAGVHRLMNEALAFNTAAKSAVDMAIYDAIGRVCGRPVANLLGGAPRGPIASSKAVSMASADKMIAQSKRFVADGFRTLKLKTGSDEAAELATVRAIRDAVGPEINIKLDANQGWDLTTATRFLRKVEPCNIQVVEQPLAHWDYAGSAELRKRTPIPIMLDEGIKSPQDVMRAIDAGACNYINIKLIKTGGLYPALDVVAVAEAAGIYCQIGSLDTTVGSAAAVHLVHAKPAFKFAEINGPSRVAFDLASGFKLSGGSADVGPGPGLGITVDEKYFPRA